MTSLGHEPSRADTLAPTDRSSTKPVVCHVVERLSFGGSQNVVQRLSSRLQDSRYEPIVCAFEGGPLQRILEAEGISVECLDLPRRSILTGPLYLVYLARLVSRTVAMARRRRVAILHAHLPDPIVLSTVVGRLCGIPVIASYHGLRTVPPDRSPLDPRNAIRRLLYRVTGKLSEKTIAVSAPVQEFLCRELGFAKEATTLILNGIETDQLSGTRVPPGLRSELGIERHHRVVTCVGRLVEHKGQRFLIEAMTRVVARHADAVLVLVGDGPSRSSLEALTTELGLDESVRFTGGRADIPELLALSDIFALSSFYEGIPVSVLEAMASGTPVVASRVPGNEDVIGDERFGVLVPPRSPDAIGDAIGELLSSPERARSLGERGRARVRDEFDIRSTVEQVISLYDEVLAARGALPSTVTKT